MQPHSSNYCKMLDGSILDVDVVMGMDEVTYLEMNDEVWEFHGSHEMIAVNKQA